MGWEESHWLLKESVRRPAAVGGPTERGAWIGHGREELDHSLLYKRKNLTGNKNKRT